MVLFRTANYYSRLFPSHPLSKQAAGRFQIFHKFSAMAGRQTIDTSQRLANLRQILASHDPKIDVFVVPSEDARAFSKE